MRRKPLGPDGAKGDRHGDEGYACDGESQRMTDSYEGGEAKSTTHPPALPRSREADVALKIERIPPCSTMQMFWIQVCRSKLIVSRVDC